MLAWIWINVWYMQDAGSGTGETRAWLMNPPQSKSDAIVMYDIQTWMDKERDYTAMGQEQLGKGFKITALQKKCTPTVSEFSQTNKDFGKLLWMEWPGMKGECLADYPNTR